MIQSLIASTRSAISASLKDLKHVKTLAYIDRKKMIMNEFNQEICYPDEIADPFYEEDIGTSAETEEELKQH